MADTGSNGASSPIYDDGIPQIAWLKEMREMRREQQQEREHQTDAFVGALDRLGGKVDDNIAALRVELRRHLTVLVATFVLSFVVLGGLAGASIYFKGLGIEAGANAEKPTPTATVSTQQP